MQSASVILAHAGIHFELIDSHFHGNDIKKVWNDEKDTMKQKEVILWVVAIGALCLSFLAIFGPKLQGVKSQASNRNTLQLQSTTVGTFTDATGTACIKAANKELNDCKKEFVIGDDGITQVDRCNVQYAQSLVECAKLFTPATNDN